MQPQSFVKAREVGILAQYLFGAPLRRRRRLANVEVETRHLQLVHGEHFLHFVHELFGALDLAGVRVAPRHLFQLALGLARLGDVAVGSLHLLEVNLGHLHHAFGSQRVVGKELNPVAVFDFGLRQALRAALQVIGVGDGELGHFDHRAVGVGVNHRVPQDAPLIEIAFTGGVRGVAKQLGVAPRPLRLFKGDLRFRLAAAGREGERQGKRQDSNFYCVHKTSLAAAPHGRG